VRQGDCLELLDDFAPQSVDAIVCDPPYGIGFQGERWDGRAIREAAARAGHQRLTAPEAYEVWCRAWGEVCLRVMKPGAHLLAFGSARTSHRLAAGLEDAGLELRDTLMWLYGTGMPKSRRLPGGRGTTLKPAYEPILLARRPPDGTIEQTIAHHGTGAINIDGCRVERRHPANILCSHDRACGAERCASGCAAGIIDEAASRSASRLFYSPKVGRREREAGCQQLPRRKLDLFPNARRGASTSPARNPHPTVKPLELMRWLVRLACPPGGLVLDPFCGSGSTGAAAVLEHTRFIGIELEVDYVHIARARIAHWAGACEEGERPPFVTRA
jgi:site-specific DNA-methyltransferase (adenine-specific)